MAVYKTKFGVQRKKPSYAVNAIPEASIRANLNSPIARREMDMARNIEGPVAQQRAEAFVRSGYTSGPEIADYQRFLAGRGLYKGRIDGVWGPQTEAAQKAYRQWAAANQYKMQDSLEAGAAKEAAAARAQILLLIKEHAQFFNKKTMEQWASYADQNRYGNQQAIIAAKQLESTLSAARSKRAEYESKKKGGFWNKVKGAAGTALGVITYPGEQISQAYYAGKRSQLKGGGIGEQSLATLGGLPGLGFLAGGGRARTAIEETNTKRERDILTEKGELASFGEFITGRAEDKLNPKTAAAYRKYGGGIPTGWLPDQSSGYIDAAFQVGTDPLSYTTKASRGLGLTDPVEAAGQAALRKSGLGTKTSRLGDVVATTNQAKRAEDAGRLQYLRTSATGKALVDRIMETVAKASDAKQVQRLVKNLQFGQADLIFKTPLRERRGLIEDFLAEGGIDLAARKQALIKVSRGKAGTGEIAKVTTLRAKGGELLRKLARGDEPRGTLLPTKKSGLSLDHSIDSALIRAGTGERLADFMQRVVRPATEGLDIPSRFGRIWDAAEQSNNGAFIEAVERELKGLVNEARKSGVSADDIVNGNIEILEGTKAYQMLERLEAATAVMSGEAGDLAGTQARFDLSEGLIPKGGSTWDLVKRAGTNVGLSLPRAGKLKYSDQEARLLRAEIETAIRDVDDALADRLLDDLNRASARGSSLGTIRRTVDSLKKNPDLLDEAGRIALNDYRMAQQGLEEAVTPGLGRRAVQRAASIPLSFSEARYADQVTFEGRTANLILNASDRVEQLDRWFMGFGLDDFGRGRLRTAVSEVTSEAQMYDLIKSVTLREAKKMGIDKADVNALFKEMRKQQRDVKGTMILKDGELSTDVFTQAQLGEAIPMPDPTELRKMLTLIKAERGATAAKLRRGIDELGNRQLGSLESKGAPLTVRRILRKGHTEWKFLIVTNFYAGGIGAVGGFIGSEDKSILGRSWSALRWGAAAQATAPLRYLMRVVGIEERLRIYLEAGLTPQMWIPVIGKRLRQRGIPEGFGFQSYDLIKGSSAPIEWLQAGNKHLVTVDRGWEKLGPKQPRFVDAWFRNVNAQFHVESDPIAEILLKEQAGLFSRLDADEEIAKFLKTAEGKVFVKRIRSGSGNKGREVESIIERYREFRDHHFDPELAEARLTGYVDHSILEQAVKAGRGPELIHAPKTFLLPKNVREVFQFRNRLASKFILEGPTTKMNRAPLGEYLYRDRFLTLTKNGVPWDRAQREADEYAVRRTNEVLFNINDESRFAAKADVFAPFQQPREEMVRVWGKIVSRNPGRTLVVAANAARAFNAGQENGTFTKDPLSGDYVLRVPGSGALSALFGNTIGMEQTLKDYLFFGQGAYNAGFLPSPGGPYWAGLARTVLDTEWGAELVESMPKPMRELLFPYGADGQLYARQGNRLWMALTYSTPPWEIFAKHDQENTLLRTEQMVFAELVAEHRRTDPDFVPGGDFYKKEVVPAVQALLKTWALTSHLTAAAPRPLWANRREYDKVREIYTDKTTGELDISGMTEDHPWTQTFIDMGSGTVSTEPDTFDNWWDRVQRTDPDLSRLLRQYKYKGARPYVAILQEAAANSKAMQEMFGLTKIPNPLEREEALAGWRERNPELATKMRNNYEAKKELSSILYGYPRGMQDTALDKWRRHYDVSPGKFSAWKREIESGRFRTNPWQDARDMEDVYADVRKKMRQGFNEDAYVASLQPAEQIRYWNQKMLNLNTDSLGKGRSAKSVMDEWKLLKSKQSQVWQAHPFLGGLPKPKSAMEKAIATWQGDYRQGINDLWTQINALTAAKNQAADSKNWGVYYKLKGQIDSLHDARMALLNKMYHEVPSLPGWQDELRGNFAFGGPKGRGGEGDFIFSNEEKAYVAMPDGIKAAYVEDLVDRLDQENFTKGKLFWEWMTDFQRDLLESNLPKDDLDYFKGLSPDSGGKGGGGFGGGGGRFTFTAERNEIGFAIQAFKDYNKRPAGAKPPAAYAEYMKLPNDSVVRGEFLKAHPEVRDWVKLGPMANMPPVLRYIVANIMVKYGRWEGEQREYAEITDLAFAQEQMNRFNLRKDQTKPAAYDVWVNMPTGAEKAAFLKAHPEVAQWIQLGPMANMPEEYQDVVRDIMLRYGEWTERDDPLGNVVRGFYKLPQHAREQYLKDHPELPAYWAATRSPQEQAQHALADQYFALNDQGAKRFFLLTHPELQSWFIEQRTKRYERFLNRVAVYMGQNPEMFEGYLKRQEDILSELLTRFAESPLIRELRPQSAAKAVSGESGRTRRPAA